MIHRVEFQGVKKGEVKRHGCPSHGIALTPDEKELWVVDGANNFVHVFDNTVMPPKQVASIKLRDSPGWFSFSLDGKFGYSSTGEILSVATRKVVAALKDETGRDVSYDLDGYPARTVQHELDHLDGVLTLDRASKADRRTAMRALRRSR